MHKDLRSSVRKAQRNGWVLTRGGSHFLLRKHDQLIVIAHTYSDHRGIRNVLSEMKKRGAI